MLNDVVILGSGPAGLTCAIYNARAGLKPIVIAGDLPGGQLIQTDYIENYPGFERIAGSELMMKMIEQAEALGVKFVFEKCKSILKKDNEFLIFTESEEILKSKTVLVATGASHKHIGVSGEIEFYSKGVSACATCDGPMYKDKKVAVVGGGNTAILEALFLTNFANEVTLIHRRDTLRADKIMQDRLFANPKVKIMWNSVVDSIEGDVKLTSINVKDVFSSEISKLEIEGLFVAIGTKPSTEFLNGMVEVDIDGYILTNQTKTSIEGMFAAGDVESSALKQAIYAAGQGSLASYKIEEYLGVR